MEVRDRRSAAGGARADGCSDAGQPRRLHLHPVPGARAGRAARSHHVESVFSGVKRLLGDFAATMSPEVLELYVFIHYNWQYDFMRPTIDEIVKTYIRRAPVLSLL